MSKKEEEIQEQETASSEQNNTEESSKNTSGPDVETRQFGEAESDEKIQLLEQELLEEKNKHLRLYAEFENFRKRTAKERLELIGTSTGDLMKEILPILDDFERAIQSNKEIDDINAIKEGFELLHNKMLRLLGNKGLKQVDSKGDAFDPEIHEAIAQVPADKKDLKGKVIDVIEKGYKLNEKMIRHPKVVVGT